MKVHWVDPEMTLNFLVAPDLSAPLSLLHCWEPAMRLESIAKQQVDFLKSLTLRKTLVL